MPVQPLDAAIWEQLASHVDSASALVERVQQVQEQSRALLAAERAILADLRQVHDAAHAGANATIGGFSREHLDTEKALVIDTRNNIAAALAFLVSTLENAASHEALFAEAARVNLGIPSRYLEVTRERLEARQASNAAQ